MLQILSLFKFARPETEVYVRKVEVPASHLLIVCKVYSISEKPNGSVVILRSSFMEAFYNFFSLILLSRPTYSEGFKAAP